MSIYRIAVPVDVPPTPFAVVVVNIGILAGLAPVCLYHYAVHLDPMGVYGLMMCSTGLYLIDKVQDIVRCWGNPVALRALIS